MDLLFVFILVIWCAFVILTPYVAYEALYKKGSFIFFKITIIIDVVGLCVLSLLAALGD